MGVILHLALVLGGGMLLLAPPVACCGRGAMLIERNGYRQVVVAVGEDVPETPNLVNRIKEVFTATSQRLYQATRNRAYLADIKILLPSTWAPKPEYKMAGTEQMDTSDVMISNFNNSESIFVSKGTDCGEPGHFIHISPSVLLNSRASEIYGPLDKVLVHEFAHLRYGVFDEHPSGDVPRFYHGATSKVEATRCSQAITGSMYDGKTKNAMCKGKGNLPDDNCRFRAGEESGMKGFGSLMYRPYLGHVDGFCDSNSTKKANLHNPYAPNMHNRRCNGRSVWDVILSHKDFANNKNLPRVISNTAPTFTVMQAVTKRYVLVLDMSGGPSILPNLRSACSNFLLNMVRDGEKVGIVWFHARAFRAANLTVINEQNRLKLFRALPRQSSSFSCIGCGVREAIKVLKESGGAAGAHLIIITTREQNKSPVLLEVLKEIRDSRVIIHSIAYNDGASSKTDTVARWTGGHSFLNNDRTTLDEAFNVITELNRGVKGRRTLVTGSAMTAPKVSQYVKTVIIDSKLGFNTKFIFTYGKNNHYISIKSPTGKVYLRNSPIVRRIEGICTFTFNGQGETGIWTVRVRDESSGSPSERFITTVLSQMPPQSHTYPIVAQAFWEHKEIFVVPGKPIVQTIYTSVSQGYQSVLGAAVEATVDSPNAKGMNVTLHDTGSGPDVHANDGIYSGYFKQFGDNGRYVVKVVAESTAGTVVSSVRVVGTRPPTREQETSPDVLTPVSPPVRCEASGGSFTLNDFVKPTGQVYAPGRVADLRVGEVDLMNRTVQLLWTSTGAELDTGRLSAYEIRYSTDFKGMAENFAGQTLVTQSMLLRGKLHNPSSPRALEDFLIRVPRSGNITYVFRLLSKNLLGRTSLSEPSNLVSAGMMIFIPTPPPGSNTNTTAIILISIFSVLLVIAIVVAVFIGLRHVIKQRQSRPTKPTSRFVKVKPTGKVQPVSRMPGVGTDHVEEYGHVTMGTLHMPPLKAGETREIPKTLEAGEAYSEPYMNTCTLVSIE